MVIYFPFTFSLIVTRSAGSLLYVLLTFDEANDDDELFISLVVCIILTCAISFLFETAGLFNEGVYTFGLFLLRLSSLAYFLLPDLCALYAWVLFSLYLAIIYISTVGDVLYCYQIIYLVRDRERGEFKAVIVNVSL